MKKFEIFIQDLTPEKQAELIELLGGENGNYDIIPLAIIEIEDDADV
jgi:hypothetical protein